MKQCTKCGSKEIDHGWVGATPNMHLPYVSNKKRTLSFGVPTYASVCLSCGYIELYASPADIKKAMKKEK